MQNRKMSLEPRSLLKFDIAQDTMVATEWPTSKARRANFAVGFLGETTLRGVGI
jgi:hypothetical protein